MKILFRLLLIPLIFIGLEKLTRTQTDGFRIEKTKSDYSYKEKWEVPTQNLPEQVLNQNFKFLGSGVQCYAFLGDDQETVLKVFKHYHFGLNSGALRKLPHSFVEKKLSKREKRIDTIFKSAILSQTTLAKQTGVFHININPTNGKYPTVTIYDKIGVQHTLDLDNTPFLLQKKADLISTYLKKHPDQTIEILDSMVLCMQNRSNQNIINSDPIIDRNYGVIEGRVVEIDIGSFSSSIKPSKQHLNLETRALKSWAAKNTPQHSVYLEQLIKRMGL